MKLSSELCLGTASTSVSATVIAPTCLPVPGLVDRAATRPRGGQGKDEVSGEGARHPEALAPELLTNRWEHALSATLDDIIDTCEDKERDEGRKEGRKVSQSKVEEGRGTALRRPTAPPPPCPSNRDPLTHLWPLRRN